MDKHKTLSKALCVLKGMRLLVNCLERMRVIFFQVGGLGQVDPLCRAYPVSIGVHEFWIRLFTLDANQGQTITYIHPRRAQFKLVQALPIEYA